MCVSVARERRGGRVGSEKVSVYIQIVRTMYKNVRPRISVLQFKRVVGGGWWEGGSKGWGEALCLLLIDL